jgi:hypothetical protein
MGNYNNIFNYQTLIKIFPIGFAMNVFANAFMKTNTQELHIHIAFFLIFCLLTFDYIVEFTKYNLKDLPYRFLIITFLIGFLIFIQVIAISFYSNINFKKYSILVVLLILSLVSFLEFWFIYLYGRYEQSKNKEDVNKLYDEKDIKIYCMWEMFFFFLYLIFSFLSLIDINKLLLHPLQINSEEIAIWLGFIFLIIEVFVYNNFLTSRFKT